MADPAMDDPAMADPSEGGGSSSPADSGGGGRAREMAGRAVGGGSSAGRMGGARAYRGLTIDIDVDTVRFPDGSVGELEMVRHPGAALVVPIEAAGDGQPIVTLVRQYRYAAGGFIWEAPAGKLSPGESPEVCARRELEEETGLRALSLERLGSIYTTPGFTDEVIHLFMALEVEAGTANPGASEFIEVHRLTLGETQDMMATGEIVDAKTICGLTLSARRLERKGRQSAGGAKGER